MQRILIYLCYLNIHTSREFFSQPLILLFIPPISSVKISLSLGSDDEWFAHNNLYIVFPEFVPGLSLFSIFIKYFKSLIHNRFMVFRQRNLLLLRGIVTLTSFY